MIIINRELSQKRKKKKGQKIKKKKGQVKKEIKGDNATILFSTLVLQSSTMIFMMETLLCCHFHILVGIFHYRTWLVYSNNGPPQVP